MSWFAQIAASGALLSASVRKRGPMRRTAGRRFDFGAARMAAAAVTLAPALGIPSCRNLGQTGRVGLRASRTVSYGRSKHTVRCVHMTDVRPEP